MSPVLLRVVGLELERGGFGLFRALDLEVEAGAAVAIEAGNGVGKTTLLRALAGLIEPAAGRVEFPLAAARRFMAHQLAVKGLLSVMENLKFWSALDGVPASTGQIEAALQEHGLAGFEWHAGQTLSAGQRKRVALARLSLNPGLLWLLDEPFANLDPAGCALVAAAIASQRGRGGAVLLSTHGSLPVDLPGLRRVRLEAA